MITNFLTIKEQENYLHFQFCISTISSVSKILKDIQNNPEHPLTNPAFGYAIVQYAVPYTTSKAKETPSLKLKKKYIPKKYLTLHEEIMRERDRKYAHMDLSVIDPRNLNVKEVDGVIFSTYAANYIIPFHLLNKLNEIISLVDDTIENLLNESITRQKKIISKQNSTL
ncbi:hypothetical protein ND816_18075 [Leptospira levettii]|uniref:hypothetical protein n=1 Tax=Leptospira levettii TaxID=2023178 RepID=UPI00223E74AC|nr:hypothetical protein [Leptospira levettii]MCW7509759.1 hypothetical protein [Leptospira levettii]MCW7520846.1 hypothetical protein [Leptospira levettii]